MTCIIDSGLTGKPNDKKSLAQETLLSIYGTDEFGVQQANEQYVQLHTESFKEKLGFDWELIQRLNREGKPLPYYNEASLDENFEPKIYVKDNGKAYVLRNDGSKEFIQGKPLSQFENERQTKEVISFVLYQAIGGMESLIDLDLENELNLNIDSVFKSDLGKEMINAWSLSESDINEIKRRVVSELNNRKIVQVDNQDLEKELNENPDELSDEENVAFELANEGNSVVRVDSFMKNSKDTASANVKIILSMVPKIASFKKVVDKDSVTGFDYELEEAQNELGLPVFEDFNNIWSRLEDVLSGLFTNHQGSKLESVMDQMMVQIENLSKDDANMGFILRILNQAKNTGQEYKLTQFAQAFTKEKIAFYVTEMSDSSPGEYKFKVFDATEASSKSAQTRDAWSTMLAESVGDTSFFIKNDKDKFVVNTKLLKSTVDYITNLTKRLDNKELITDKERLFVGRLLSNLGIFPSDLVHTKILKRIDAETSGKADFNEERATSILLKSYINKALGIVSTQTERDLTGADGAFKNPLKSNLLVKMYSDEQAKYGDGLSEATVMGARGKMMWGFGLPSYISLRIHELKTNSDIFDGLSTLTYNKRSKWIAELRNNPNIKIDAVTFASFQKAGEAARADDNKSIQKLDQITDHINKYLLGFLPSETSIFYTPAPADKGRSIAIKGFKPTELTLDYTKNGFNVNLNSEGINTVLDYFEDELDRMNEVYNQVNDEGSKKYVHYHLKSGKLKDDLGFPIGNGYASQLFPDLSPQPTADEKAKGMKTSDKIAIVNSLLGFDLYAKDGRINPLVDANRLKVKKYIAEVLKTKINRNVDKLIKDGAFLFDPKENLYKNNIVDSRLWSLYSQKTNNVNLNTIRVLTADYLINGIIGNTEYAKLFTGDIAYYKDSIDYSKRIPSTYTDGKLLVGIKDLKDATFNIAIIKGVEISAPDIDTMKQNFIDSLKASKEFMPDDVKKIYTTAKINELADAVTSQYKKVNTTDAQAWITLDRWKFLKTHLDGWNPSLEATYQRMQDGTFGVEDLKHAAQPLKGVYFNQNHATGIPTFLKYSQAVLIPSLVKNTPMERVLESMKNSSVDELITLDGVKVGALDPTGIHDIDGTVLEEIKFNVQTLSNLHWKLQQQLTPKGLKDSADLGSQLQKNVISNLNMTATYGTKTGAEHFKLINDAIVQLTEMGFTEAIDMLGASRDGEVLDRDRMYETLIQEAKSKNMPYHVIDALERGYSLDAIPQIRYKSQNMLSSIVNGRVAKTTTPGGAMIQVSNFGLDKIGVTKSDLLKLSKTIDIEDLYSKLGNKTESGNVKIVKSIFENKNNKNIITAFRVDKKSGLLESFRQYNAIGNPINWQDFKPRFEGDNATIAFMDWFIGKDYNNLEQEYRNEIINNLSSLKGKQIEYYKELDRPSHATALDYLINKYNWNNKVTSNNKEEIYMLKDINGLKRPEITPIGDKKIVTPGQVFLPHSFIAKYVPNYKELKPEELKKIVDERLFKLIGYRIPNQKLSSNQPLEVVGILGPEMGDSIVMYTEITMQTGSDFDIDKTYVMLPAFDVEYSDKEKTKVSKLSYVEPSQEKPNKKQLQNQLFESYWDILTSPLSYFDMMSGIDGTALKDGINRLHGERTTLSNLEIVDPLYQIDIKFDNSTGKSGLGLAANQMVDHPYSQIYGIKMNHILGIGHVKDGMLDLSQIYDTDGNKILDSVSMFINAFVDIAKDPYVTKGNFNTVTSNLAFLMLRAGVPLDYVIAYIGQPAFKSVVKKVLDSKSKVSTNKRAEFKDFIKQTRIELEMEYNLIKSPVNDLVRREAEEMSNALSSVSKSLLEDNIINQRVGFQSNLDKAKYIGSQIGLLETLSDNYDAGEKLSAQVLASKADVNGGNGDIVSHFIGLERLNKVLNSGDFAGLEAKFAPDSMLGSKTDKSLKFLNKLDENLYLTMNDSFKNIYKVLNKSLKGMDYVTNGELVKIAERAAYTYVVSQAFSGTQYEYTQEEIEPLFVGENSIATRVSNLVLDDEIGQNMLIKALTIAKTADGIKYVSLNNFMNKPTSSLEELNRAWEELFDNPKTVKFATDLVKYTMASSGMNKTRHSLHEILPIRVSDIINNGLMRLEKEDLNDIHIKFLEDFTRHVQNEDLVPSVSLKGLSEFYDIESLGKAKKGSVLFDLKTKYGLLGGDIITLDLNVTKSYPTKDQEDKFELIKANKILKIPSFEGGVTTYTYYENVGVVDLKMVNKDGVEKISSKVVLMKTHKLGYDQKGVYIYEYGQASQESKLSTKKSAITQNNPGGKEYVKYDNIKRFTKELLKEVAINHTPFKYTEVNQGGSSNTALDNQTNNGNIQRRCQ